LLPRLLARLLGGRQRLRRIDVGGLEVADQPFGGTDAEYRTSLATNGQRNGAHDHDDLPVLSSSEMMSALPVKRQGPSRVRDRQGNAGVTAGMKGPSPLQRELPLSVLK